MKTGRIKRKTKIQLPKAKYGHRGYNSIGPPIFVAQNGAGVDDIVNKYAFNVEGAGKDYDDLVYNTLPAKGYDRWQVGDIVHRISNPLELPMVPSVAPRAVEEPQVLPQGKLNRSLSVNKPNRNYDDIEMYQSGGKTNPPIYTSDPNDPRLQKYVDSLDYSRFSDKAHNFENVPLNNYITRVGEKNWNSFMNREKEEPTNRAYYDKKTDTYTPIWPQPVQPYIYKDDFKPKAQGITDIPTSDVVPEFQSIPFKQGSYFTRPRQSQELDQGMMDYFDKQTGKSLGSYQAGGIIDSRGQWAHPGKVTTIPGNDITMKGVPYPVMGVSNTGDRKMMMPGKDYAFRGDFVTEFPMMNGGIMNSVETSRQQVEAESGIHIKKSHRGLLHENLGVPAGHKIPASKLKVKSTDSPAVKKRKIFAQNAKKWHHENGGSVKWIIED